MNASFSSLFSLIFLLILSLATALSNKQFGAQQKDIAREQQVQDDVNFWGRGFHHHPHFFNHHGYGHGYRRYSRW